MLFAPTSPIIYKVYFLIIYKVRMRIGIRVCKISIKIPQTINFNVFCKLLHSAFEPKAVKVVPPCRAQPVGVLLRGEVSDVQRNLSRHRTAYHTNLHVGVVVLVVPAPAYATLVVGTQQCSLTHLVMAPHFTPNKGEGVAFELHIVGYPLTKSVGGADKLPHNIA